ncbi:MAG: hypothetical protein RLZ10_2356 [Bacteroidota bacterium]|jgi:hypothetical protein
MKFQEGDNIIILATGETGEVIEWINKKMLTVRVGEVEFPVYADQIDFPYFNSFSSTKKDKVKSELDKSIPKSEKKFTKSIPEDGILLSFFPVLEKEVFDEDVISHFKIYLHNYTIYPIQFSLSVYFGHAKSIDLTTSLRSLEEIYLLDLPFEKLNDQPHMDFQFSRTDDTKRSFHQDIRFKIKPKQFFAIAEKTIRDQRAFFHFKLIEELLLEKMEIEKKESQLDLSKLKLAGFKVRDSP